MMHATIEALDAICQERQGQICPWHTEARKVVQQIIDKKNGGVNLGQWSVSERQKIAKWLKRERGISLYLQRKRSHVKSLKKKQYIPYYLDALHANALNLRPTPAQATEYTHSVRALYKDDPTLMPEMVQTLPITASSYEHVPQAAYEEHVPEAASEEHVPLPPLPYPINNSFSYGLDLNAAPSYSFPLTGANTEFSSYYYHPIDPYHLAWPPLENTNQADNVVS